MVVASANLAEKCEIKDFANFALKRKIFWSLAFFGLFSAKIKDFRKNSAKAEFFLCRSVILLFAASQQKLAIVGV